MRIDFYHIDLLKNPSKFNKVKKVDAECTTATYYTYSQKHKCNNCAKNFLCKDYFEIKEELLSNEELDNSKDFLSDSELNRFKNLINDNDYKVNLRTLSLSLIKYIERS